MPRKTVLAAILLFVCGIAVQLWRNFAGAHDAEQAVEHTYRVLNTAERFLSAMTDAETGQRGYLLTGDENYLEPYHAALGAERALRSRLGVLVAGNPVQSARAKELDRVVELKLEELAATIQTRQKLGHAAALGVMRSGEGKRLMDNLRAIIQQIEVEERQLVVQRQATAHRQTAEMQWTLLAGFVTLLALLSVTGVSVERYMLSRERAERAVRASEERLRRVLDNLPDVVVLYNRERQIQYINSQTTFITGMTPDQFVGRREEDIFPPEVCAEIVPVLEAAIQTRVPQSREIGLTLPKTGLRHLHIRCVPLLDEAGTMQGLVGITHDLTEWKAAQEALRQRTEREFHTLQAMVAAAPVGLVMLDRNLRQLQASQCWLDDVGLKREQVIGKLHYECFPNLPESWKAAHQRGLAGEEAGSRDEFFTAPDGTLHWVNWGIRPWGDEGETTGGIIIYSEDITERKRTEQEAHQSEMRFRALFDHMNQGLAFCEAIFEDGEPTDFIYRNVNEAFSTLTGLRDVIGKRISEVIPGVRESDPELIRAHGRVAASGHSEKFELWVEAQRMWYSVSAYSPEPNFFVSIFDVITERKKAEIAAREWRRAFEQTEIGIALVKPGEEVFSAVNTTFARQRGYLPEELIGRPIALVNPPERLQWMRETVERANHDAGHVTVESVHCRKDGSRFPVQLDLTGVKDESGQLVSRIVVAHDLTERKLAEEESERSQALYLAIARNLPGTGVFVVDHDLRYVAVEGNLPARLGLPRDALLGRTVRDVLKLPLATASEQRFHETLGGGLVTSESEIQGCAIWTRFVPLRDAAGNVVAAMALSTDVTARKRAEEEIRLLNEDLEERVRTRTVQLEAANKELEAFSYSVSHDLRAPLRGIDGWSMALMEDYGPSLDATALSYLSRVRSETQRMGLLIDDLLRLSRVTRSEMRHEDVDLSELARRVSARLQEQNPNRRVDFRIEDALPVRGDPRLLEVVLTNLLNNAVKFTARRDDARIEVGVTEAEGGRAYFVRDNGVGFNMAYASSLFGAFQRLHKASEFPGTGVGLATVQRIVRRHGGRAWAEAELGSGATFYFTIGESEK